MDIDNHGANDPNRTDDDHRVCGVANRSETKIATPQTG